MVDIAELLKDCPKGMELDCSMYDYVTLISVDNKEGINFPICVRKEDGNHIKLTKYGQYTKAGFAKCVIFPKGKTTWEGFVPPCKFKDGDVITDSLGTCIFKGEGRIKGTVDFYCGVHADFFIVKDDKIDPDKHYGNIVDHRFATEEEKEKLFQAIKDNGYKWDAEAKTLEELAEPKFHKGDWITCEELNTAKILSINVDKYEVEFIDGNNGFPHIDYVDRNFHLWTIQDAKDGDILFHSDSASNGIFIFKEILQQGKIHIKGGTIQKVICYCDYDSEDGFCLGENHTCCWTDSKILHPATKAQCNLLSQKIKEAGYKWDEETKTLEKLITPKFKVGDYVVKKGGINAPVLITGVSDEYYSSNTGNSVGVFRVKEQDDWELAKKRFDITTLKSFDRVLVRLNNDTQWYATLFSHIDERLESFCMHYVTVAGKSYTQMIPYEGNEHLCGTKDECDDFYKNW